MTSVGVPSSGMTDGVDGCEEIERERYGHNSQER